MDHSLFNQLTAVLLAAGLIALLISLLKQPSVIAFIITGILVGSVGYAQAHSFLIFSDFGAIGITLLLFMVGLELDFRRIRELGTVVLYTAVGQILISSTVAFSLARLLHFEPIAALYIAMALTFSSTIVVVKLLGERRELQSLHGRIVVGLLIVQDFAALIILLFLGGASHGSIPLISSLPLWQEIMITLVRALIFFLALAFISRKILPWLLKYLSRSDELLLLFSLGWALGLAAFAQLPWVGFSIEIGGFLAGLALANSQVHWEIAARVKSIRDFFIIIFFIVFGSQLAFSGTAALLPQALLFSLLVLVVNPLVIMGLLGKQGYKTKTAFFVGSAMTPMSEFSFILVALGSQAGQVDQSVVSLVTLVGLISIACSSYAISKAGSIYRAISPLLLRLGLHGGNAERGQKPLELKHHIVLVGAHRLGQHLVSSLQKMSLPLVIVDLNPEVVSRYTAEGIEAVCGDITENYIQEEVNLREAQVIISTMPNFEDNLALIESVRTDTAGKRIKPKLIFAAQTEAEAKQFYQEEIDYALSPHFIGGQHLARILEGRSIGQDLKKLKADHIKILGD